MNRLLLSFTIIFLCISSFVYADAAQTGIAITDLYFFLYGLSIMQAAITECIALRLLLPKLAWEHVLWLTVSMNVVSLVGILLPLLLTGLFMHLIFMDVITERFIINLTEIFPGDLFIFFYIFFVCIVTIFILKAIVAKIYISRIRYKGNFTLFILSLLLINSATLVLSMFELNWWTNYYKISMYK